MDDADRERKLRQFKPNAKRGGQPVQGSWRNAAGGLKETTMDPARRTLLKVVALAADRATHRASWWKA